MLDGDVLFRLKTTADLVRKGLEFGWVLEKEAKSAGHGGRGGFGPGNEKDGTCFTEFAERHALRRVEGSLSAGETNRDVSMRTIMVRDWEVQIWARALICQPTGKLCIIEGMVFAPFFVHRSGDHQCKQPVKGAEPGSCGKERHCLNHRISD